MDLGNLPEDVQKLCYLATMCVCVWGGQQADFVFSFHEKHKRIFTDHKFYLVFIKFGRDDLWTKIHVSRFGDKSAKQDLRSTFSYTQTLVKLHKTCFHCLQTDF